MPCPKVTHGMGKPYEPGSLNCATDWAEPASYHDLHGLESCAPGGGTNLCRLGIFATLTDRCLEKK